LRNRRPVPRPYRKSDFEIFFTSPKTEKKWNDLFATRRNDLTSAWEFLTDNPTRETALFSEMDGKLATVEFEGMLYQRYQLKLSLTHGSRIWYFIVGNHVFIDEVFTSHPNQTK
jgi:hypothetical protein